LAVEYRYSTFWPRFLAGFYDGFFFLPVTLFDNYLSSPARPVAVLIAWALFSYPAYWVYSVALHAYRGQTVGKKWMFIKVMDLSEHRIPSVRQALLRDIGAIIPNSLALIYFIYLVSTRTYTEPLGQSNHWPIIVLGSANLLWFFLEVVTMLTNSKRRALHDVIAGTVVVRVDPVPVGLNPIREILNSPPAGQ
jgi:uncharacterized RDD family membrane protein YckC